VTGHQPLHQQIEQRFARFKRAEAALVTPTGFMANFAVLTTLAGPGDLICLDKLNHASLIDAARAGGATMRVFGHRNYTKLDRLLARFAARTNRGVRGTGDHRASDLEPSHPARPARPPRAFIVTDSVFSMDGDVADLAIICDLAERYDAITIIDEAHATGVLGDTGAGLCELQGVTGRVDVVISTASKALGGLGGIITGPQVVIDTLVNHARSFIYTTAATPGQVAALDAALDVVRNEPQRRRRVLDLAARLRDRLRATLNDAAKTLPTDIVTPIVPIMLGRPDAAIALSDYLGDHGFHAPAIRPPTVASGSARVRLSLRADLHEDDVERVARIVKDWLAAHRA